MTTVSKPRSSPIGMQMMLWALPALLVLAYVLPFAGVALWSVTRPAPGMENYIRIFASADLRMILYRTLFICGASTIITVPLAYILAYYWVMGRTLTSRVMEICIFLPFWISVLVRAFGWVVILRNNGLASALASHLGLPAEMLATGRSATSVVIGMVHFMVPFAVLPMASVMRKIDHRVLLAANGLGAAPRYVFWRVFLPMSMPGIYSALAVTFILSLGFFVTPMVLGGGRVTMIAEAVFVQMFQTANWGLGSALGIVLLLFVVAVLWLVQRVVKLDPSVTRQE